MKYTRTPVGTQSSNPLYLAAALYLTAGVYHYAAHGADFQAVLPLPARYDLARDPGADIANGLAQARALRKRVLITVGGDWCPPCENMDRFLREDESMAGMLAAHFVLVRVAVPQRGTDIPALASLPHIEGFPHLFVLDGDGRLLASKETDDLELGETYDRDKFLRFLYEQIPPDPRLVDTSTGTAPPAVLAR